MNLYLIRLLYHQYMQWRGKPISDGVQVLEQLHDDMYALESEIARREWAYYWSHGGPRGRW